MGKEEMWNWGKEEKGEPRRGKRGEDEDIAGGL